MFHFRFIPIITLLTVCLFFTGCYGYRVDVLQTDPITEPESTTAHSLFWGLIQNPQYILADNCHSNALNDIYITTNYSYAFVTVVSLGIWAPIDIEWRCAEKPKADGHDDGML